VEVNATGIDVSVSSTYVGSLKNSGDIQALATVAMDLRADATSTGDFVSAAIAFGSFVSLAAAGYLAQVSGSMTGDLDNAGKVTAQALFRGLGSAVATGGTNDAGAAVSFHVSAQATGVALVVSGSQSGSSTNSGDIVAVAAIELGNAADGALLAAALSETSTAQALQKGSLHATATGLRIVTTQLHTGNQGNSGDVTAKAAIDALLDVKATGFQASGSANATLSLSGLRAEALGVLLQAATLEGTASNSGAISALARVGLGGRTADGAISATVAAHGASALARVLAIVPTGALAIGLHADYDTLNGDFTNSGAILARGVVDVAFKVEATGVYSATAIFGGESARFEAEALGLLFEGQTVDGSIGNAGKITAAALNDVKLSVLGTLSGGIGARASALIEVAVAASATGLAVRGPSLTVEQGFTNDGEILSVARAALQGGTEDLPEAALASALGGTRADARGLADVFALAKGLAYGVATQNGDIVNSAKVVAQASATINLDVLAEATRSNAIARATLEATGEASAFGIDVAATSMDGDLRNSGAVSASAAVRLGGADDGGLITATVLADAKFAAAKLVAPDSSNITATAVGIRFAVDTFNGEVVNEGKVQAQALIEQHYLVHAMGSGEAGALATGQAYKAYARALDIDAPLAKGVTNSDDLVASAAVDIGLQAKATGGGASARYAGILEQTAIGLDIGMPTLAGPLVNSGDILAEAHGKLALAALASDPATDGDQVAARVALSANATASGIAAYLNSIDGDFTNEGNITAWAHLTAAVTAKAASYRTNAPPTPTTRAASATLTMGRMEALAVGIGFVVGQPFEGKATNSGEIKAYASIEMDLQADAVAVTGNAEARVRNDDAQAHAVGLSARFLAGLTGDIENSGKVTAQAVLRATGSASAKSTGTSAVAFAFHSMEAIAKAAQMTSLGPQEGSMRNSGDLVAVAIAALVGGTADVDAPLRVTASSAEKAKAMQSMDLVAIASGLRMVGSGAQTGELLNSGSVQARALADSFLEAEAVGDLAAATIVVIGQVAAARGVRFQQDTLTGNATNEGAVTANAIVEAGAATAEGAISATIAAKGEDAKARLALLSSGSGGSAFGASAFGVLFVIDSVEGSLANSGDVTAAAAIDLAYALEATGTRRALAFASEYLEFDARARGVQLSNASTVDGNVGNEGELKAYATISIALDAAASLVQAVTPPTLSAVAFVDLSSIQASATGFGVRAGSVSGAVSNSGDVTAKAAVDALIDVWAAATSLSGLAEAGLRLKGVAAHALGVNYSGDTIDGLASNAGSVSVLAQVVLGGATASGAISATVGAAGRLAAARFAGSSGNLPIEATATGVLVAYGSLGGGFANSGDVKARALIDTDYKVQAAGNIAASAQFGSEGAHFDANAVGVLIEAIAIGSNIGNSGKVSAAAIDVLNLSVLAARSASDVLLHTGPVALVDFQIDATATGLAVRGAGLSVNGNFTNEGEVLGLARVAVQGGPAEAPEAALVSALGVTGATASAFIDAFAWAKGLVYTPATQVGDVDNKAKVGAQASAVVNLDVRAETTGSGASGATAKLTAMPAAFAEALIVDGVAMTGDVRNSATVTALAVAKLGAAGTDGEPTSTVRAEGRLAQVSLGTGTFPAVNALARGINVDFDAFDGDFANAGKVTAQAFAEHRQALLAIGSASEGFAAVKASGLSYTALAEGLVLDALGIGGVDNTGNLQAAAVLDVGLDIKASASDASVLLWVTGAKATAHGFDIRMNAIGGPLTNSGDIEAKAVIGFDIIATASGLGSSGAALAEVKLSNVTAKATGLTPNLATLGGNFENEGAVDAAAIIAITATMLARGNDVGVTPSALAGDAALSLNRVVASATGVQVVVGDSFGGTLLANAGEIGAVASIVLRYDVSARGTSDGVSAMLTNRSMGAKAIGLELKVTGGGVTGDVTNSGDVAAQAAIVAIGGVLASGSGFSSGDARAFVFHSMTADALGVNLETVGPHVGDQRNSGDVSARAVVALLSGTADADLPALASAWGGGRLSATQAAVLRASASGLLLGGFGTLTGDIGNSGKVQAAASVAAQLAARAAGSSNHEAFALLRLDGVSANALGIAVAHDNLVGNVLNEGSVTAVARIAIGGATESGSAIGYLKAGAPNGTAEARLFMPSSGKGGFGFNAAATGVSISIPSVTGNLTNNGAIVARAGIDLDYDLDARGFDNAIAAASGSLIFAANAQALWIADTVVADGEVDNASDLVAAATIAVHLDAFASLRVLSAIAAASNIGALLRLKSLHATATGFLADLDTVTGGIDNSGKVTAQAALDLSLRGEVRHNGSMTGGIFRAEAVVNESVGLHARAFSVVADTIGGALTNSGALKALALGYFALAVDASGTQSAFAHAVLQGASIQATGLAVEAGGLGGGIDNEGGITAQARAAIGLEARAVASESGMVTADAGVGNGKGSGVLALRAAGIDVRGAGTIGVGFANSGDIVAIAAVDAAGEDGGIFASASGGNDAVPRARQAPLEAYASAISLSSITELQGAVTNEGKLSALARLELELTAYAFAAEFASAGAHFIEDTKAKATFVGEVKAYGFRAEIFTITGQFFNEGAIVAQAVVDIAASAVATGATFASVGARASQIVADAAGILLTGRELQGGFVNSATVQAQAVADFSVAAVARSAETGNGAGVIRDAAAGAHGILIGFTQVDQGIINHGKVLATAFLGIGADPEVGPERDAFVRVGTELAPHAGAEATFLAQSLDAYATGMNVFSDSVSGGVRNEGTVQAVARMVLELDARAEGTKVGRASALGSILSVGAAGIAVDAAVLEGGFRNGGTVQAFASLTATISASAFGPKGGTAAAAIGNVHLYAIGLELEGGATEQATGGFENDADGKVSARAKAVLTVDALADDTATAKAPAITARAIGMNALNYESLAGGFRNDGTVLARADVTLQAFASSIAGSGEVAQAKGVASAFGLSFYGTGNTLSGGMGNAGLIQVSAFASVLAQGGTAGGFDGSADAWAKAYAVGMHVNASSLAGDMANEGTIVVRASGKAFEFDAAASTPIVVVSAFGMQGSVIGTATGGLVNSGNISVFATANAPAFAAGQALLTGVWTGALENAAGGDVRVFASDAFKATAIGLLATGAEIQGGLQNAGIIVAQAVGDASLLARAIDVTHHFGSGVEIRMVDGTIEAFMRATRESKALVDGTAVAMQDNTVADTLQWSGGLVLADIVGTSLDTMNVFAGADAAFNFSDEIRGVGEINVNTTAKAGTPVALRINGIVSDVGLLNVNENGTLRVGLDAQIAVDTYDQDDGGTVVFEITAEPDPSNGIITVANIAHLAGGIEIAAQPGYYDGVQTYLLIDGELDGAFTETPNFDNSPLLSFTLEQNNPDVTLIVVRTPFDEVPGLTENQKALSEVLEDLYDPLALPDQPPGGLGDVMAALFGLTTGEYYAALNDLHGAEYAQMAYAAFQSLEFLSGGVNQRLADGRSVGGGAGQSASLGQQSLQYAAIGAADGDLRNTQMAAIGNDPDRPGSLWGRGYGAWGSLDGDAEAPGYDRTSGAIVAGIDYRFDGEFLVGLAGAYSFSSLDFDDGDQGDIDSWQIGLFGSWDSGTWYVDAMVSYAFQNYETTRHIAFLGERAEADYDGQAVQAYGELGYQFAVGQQGLLTPLVGLSYTSVWTDSFTETGASGANLRVDEARYESLATTVGLRGSLALDGWEPSLFLGWRHEFLDDHGEADLAFAAVPDAKWTVIGSDVARNAGLVGVGVVAEISAQVEAVLDYGGQFSGSGTSHTGSLGLRLKF